MRVVGGSARGRPLRAPAGGDTRPTGDRVRESVFNMLASLDAVEGARVLDLFAGSGALAIEALSRGADSAVLVDQSPAAVEAERHNLAVLDEPDATVVRSDAFAYLASSTARFDVVFADPPYAFDRWPALLERLRPCTGLLVAESGWDRHGDLWSPGPGWETVKVKRYGDTVVGIALPASPATPVEEGES